jgi:hypothetical protein
VVVSGAFPARRRLSFLAVRMLSPRIESVAAFGSVEVVVHTTTDSTAALYLCGARHVSRHGVIVSTSNEEHVAPDVGLLLRERGIAVERVPPERVLGLLDAWRQKSAV